MVASLAEAWIEIHMRKVYHEIRLVASLAEAWIEMVVAIRHLCKDEGVASLAEAWIEITAASTSPWRICVASLAEAWIEIGDGAGNQRHTFRRLPRGGVD